MIRRVCAGWLALSFLAVMAVAAAEKTAPAKPDDDYELIRTLVDSLDQVERNYVKDVNRRDLVEAAIQGMLAKLDPYSTYINPEQTGQFRTSVENEFGGIGIQIDGDESGLKVASPIYGTPAYRAGIIAGDRIVAIEGESTEKIDREEAIHRLKGAPGTKVTLTVVHAHSDERRDVTLTREMIHVETVLGYRRASDDTWDYTFDHDRRLGFIRLTAFSRDTARDLRRVLRDLNKSNLRGLILDLRFNPGGLLNSAIEVSGMFISKGRIVSTSGRNSPERTWDAHPGEVFENFPMVILVNRFSASASEIVAACLQDHKRALVVGERTWGKGSVQNVIELEGGNSLLKLTTASYKRPSGKNIHRFPNAREDEEWGVMPDKGYELKLGEKDTYRLMLDRRDRDILQPHVTKSDEARAVAKAAAKPSDAIHGLGARKASEKRPASDQSTGPATATPGDDKKPPNVKKPVDATVRSSKRPTAEVKSDEAKFVDRQLQMAVDYLNGELARVDKK